jgi:hypothetical protein
MIKAFTGKTYTADRENMWRKLEYGGFNSNIIHSVKNGIAKTSEIDTALIDISDWDITVIMSALENARGGSTLLNFSVAGITITPSWTIDPDADYNYIGTSGATIYGKRNLTHDVPHLKFISASSRYLSTGTIWNNYSCPHFSVVLHITPLVVGQEQHIIQIEDRVAIYLDADDYVNFMISDGVDTYTGKSSNKVTLKTQSRIVCIKDDATDKIIIHVDGTKTEIADIAIEPKLNGEMFIGCKDVAGTKSAYLDACLHTVAIARKTLTDADIDMIDNSIDPLGLEVIIITYDDASGTDTGIPYGLKTLAYRHPNYEYLETLTKSVSTPSLTGIGVTHA